MARTKKRLVYLEPDLDTEIKDRADQLGLSVNEWMHRVFVHALLQKKAEISITHTYKAEL